MPRVPAGPARGRARAGRPRSSSSFMNHASGTTRSSPTSRDPGERVAPCATSTTNTSIVKPVTIGPCESSCPMISTSSRGMPSSSSASRRAASAGLASIPTSTRPPGNTQSPRWYVMVDGRLVMMTLASPSTSMTGTTVAAGHGFGTFGDRPVLRFRQVARGEYAHGFDGEVPRPLGKPIPGRIPPGEAIRLRHAVHRTPSSDSSGAHGDQPGSARLASSGSYGVKISNGRNLAEDDAGGSPSTPAGSGFRV